MDRLFAPVIDWRSLTGDRQDMTEQRRWNLIRLSLIALIVVVCLSAGLVQR
jgi:hypothetical protein